MKRFRLAMTVILVIALVTLMGLLLRESPQTQLEAGPATVDNQRKGVGRGPIGNPQVNLPHVMEQETPQNQVIAETASLQLRLALPFAWNQMATGVASCFHRLKEANDPDDNWLERTLSQSPMSTSEFECPPEGSATVTIFDAPSDGVIKIVGPDLLPIVLAFIGQDGKLVWDDANALGSWLSKAKVLNIDRMIVAMSVQTETEPSSARIELVPMGRLKPTLIDSDGQSISVEGVECTISWSLIAEHRTGKLQLPIQWWAPQIARLSLGEHLSLPSGAKGIAWLSGSSPAALGAPDRITFTVDSPKQELVFRASATRSALVRVESPDGFAIPEAIPNCNYTVVPEATSRRDYSGPTHRLVPPPGSSDVAIGAVGYLSEILKVPPPSAISGMLVVVLRQGEPVLRVELSDHNLTPEQVSSIRIIGGAQLFPASTSNSSKWVSVPMPESGVYVLHASREGDSARHSMLSIRVVSPLFPIRPAGEYIDGNVRVLRFTPLAAGVLELTTNKHPDGGWNPLDQVLAHIRPVFGNQDADWVKPWVLEASAILPESSLRCTAGTTVVVPMTPGTWRVEIVDRTHEWFGSAEFEIGAGTTTAVSVGPPTRFKLTEFRVISPLRLPATGVFVVQAANDNLTEIMGAIRRHTEMIERSSQTENSELSKQFYRMANSPAGGAHPIRNMVVELPEGTLGRLPVVQLDPFRLFVGAIDREARTVTVLEPDNSAEVLIQLAETPDGADSSKQLDLSQPGWRLTVRPVHQDTDTRTISTRDVSFAVGDSKELQLTLPPGRYIARLARQYSVSEPDSEGTTTNPRMRMDWSAPVEFEAEANRLVKVLLPAARR